VNVLLIAAFRRTYKLQLADNHSKDPSEVSRLVLALLLFIIVIGPVNSPLKHARRFVHARHIFVQLLTAFVVANSILLYLPGKPQNTIRQ